MESAACMTAPASASTPAGILDGTAAVAEIVSEGINMENLSRRWLQGESRWE
jgi:hypothetical protein